MTCYGCSILFFHICFVIIHSLKNCGFDVDNLWKTEKFELFSNLLMECDSSSFSTAMLNIGCLQW